MKEVKQYKCEFCNTSYSEESDCVNCEKQHVALKRIETAHYFPVLIDGKYPSHIIIEFEDGTSRLYARA